MVVFLVLGLVWRPSSSWVRGLALVGLELPGFHQWFPQFGSQRLGVSGEGVEFFELFERREVL